MQDVRLQFGNPDPAYRTAPLWVWNDLISDEVIEFQLKQLKEHGFGGAFVHPRPGLVTEYLSDEWFDRWTYALETAKQLGMKLYIYDENSYPSGFAGGHVPAQLPDCLAASMTYRLQAIARNPDGTSLPITIDRNTMLSAYAVTFFTSVDGEETIRVEHDLTEIPTAQWYQYGEHYMVIETIAPQMMSWLGGFAYVDLMRPEVTEMFLQTIYEAYHTRYGTDFGTHIPAIFTDEPAVTGSTIYTRTKKDLPFSYWFAAQFKRRRGYSLLDHLPAVLKNVHYDKFVKPAEKVRFDYYCTIRELWIEHSIQPIAAWCEQHGIAWTGHFMEHCWPLVGGMMVSPSIMSAYEYFQWPAIDLLLSSPLRDTPADDLMVIMLEVQSVANQFEKERVLCETYGAGGWDSTFEDYKRMADWLFVHGINFINPHYTLMTTAGARKRDHPQSFDWRQPWWEDYTDLNNYKARASTMLARGQMRQRILVIHPTTSGYLIPIEQEDADLMAGKPPFNPDMRNYLALLQKLTTAQWDFDLGDEWIMQRHAVARDSRLSIGRQSYEIIILSGDTRNLLASTVDVLCRFLDSGGIVLASGKIGPYVDGEACPHIYDELAAMDHFHFAGDAQAICDELERRIGGRLRSTALWPQGIAHMRRELDDYRHLYFFVNHSQHHFESIIELDGAHVEKWNLWTGEQESLPYESVSGGVRVPLRLNHNESLLLIVVLWDETATLSDKIMRKPLDNDQTPKPAALEMKDWTITPEEPNVMVIDYCDLTADGETYADMHAPAAGELLFQLRGFAHNPWDNAIQYKRRIIDRDHFDDDSGFSIAYRFETAVDLSDEPLHLIVERASSYTLRVNGREVAWQGVGTWLDHHNGEADIRPYLRKGSNTITLTAPRFHVLLEIEPVYLRGNFSVKMARGNWVLDQPSDVKFGSWIHQGYPFYAGAFLYRCKVDIPDHAAAHIELPSGLEATACTLFIDGRRVGLVGMDDGGQKDVSAHLTPGVHEVSLRVCGGYKNLLGPHHAPHRERRSAWPSMWKQAPKFGKPAADQYDLIAYGLDAPLKCYIYS